MLEKSLEFEAEWAQQTTVSEFLLRREYEFDREGFLSLNRSLAGIEFDRCCTIDRVRCVSRVARRGGNEWVSSS